MKDGTTENTDTEWVVLRIYTASEAPGNQGIFLIIIRIITGFLPDGPVFLCLKSSITKK